MICLQCRTRRHGKCKGGSWCDCAHRDLVGRAMEMNSDVIETGEGIPVALDPDLVQDNKRRWK